MVHAVCERCGEVERKRCSDARTTGGGGGKVERTTTPTTTTTTTVPPNVDTAIGLPGSTEITAFPESILPDDTGTRHGVVDVDDPMMLHLPDELTTTTTTTTTRTRTHQNDTIVMDVNPNHPDDDVYAMTPVY
jgi:hypothetical protein